MLDYFELAKTLARREGETVMSRSGYTDHCENLQLYRNAVERAIRGKRGQAFLRELADVLDAMPNKRLITDELQDAAGDVCTLGAICVARRISAADIDYWDNKGLAKKLDIAWSMVAEIEWVNDEWNPWREETDEARWLRMRQWVKDNLRD